MKNKYIDAEIEVIKFDCCDIITTSDPEMEYGGDGDEMYNDGE